MSHARALAALALTALVGCAKFHAGPLPGAPADATFVDVQGVHVHYRVLGEGPTVVLIHGYGASLDSWNGVAEVIAQRHKVIAIDLKGFGWTSRPPGDYSPKAQAHLVWDVLDHLGVGDAALVGHSWGSSVVLAMALESPRRVRRIALYSAYVYDEQVPSFFRWAQTAAGEALFSLYYKQRIDERVPLAYHDERWITQARVDHVIGEMDRPGTVAAALATARGHHFAAQVARYPSIDRPVLLLWGDDDQVTPLRFGQRLASELPDAELKVYPACGHIPMVEARNPSTRDLVRFLARDLTTTSEDATASDTPGDAAPDADEPAAPRAPAPHFAEVPPPVIAPLAAPSPWEYGPGADLAALGAELTPRKFAAPRARTELDLRGALRVRSEALYNLDLDRGPDASGQPLFPVPLDGGQLLDGGDLRLRTDLAIYARGTGVAIKTRIDWLDNVGLGSTPEVGTGRAPTPAASPGQRPFTAIAIKRAWGEVLTPIGVLAAGRMGAHWGLGIVANGGDCDDCDGGDAADRIALVSPLAGHLIALAYDFSSSGPFTRRKDDARILDIAPSDDVASVTAALLSARVPASVARRTAAGIATAEYGAYVSHRWQAKDVPADYLPTATPQPITPDALVARDFSATTTGAWLRITGPRLRIEAELDYAHARVGQPSLIPGVELTQPATSDQLGFALQSAFLLGNLRVGADAGFASGDDAPGFGAFPTPGQPASPAGSLDGAQADLPSDTTVDNFRFHPDFHIDQILFREIIGTITDAAYLRPHADVILGEIGPGRLELGAALIASWAVEAASTPSGARGLGVEIDPSLRWLSLDGFSIALDYALLLPGAAFDATALAAKPAQALRLRLGYHF
ncbi:MAG: alpha/beta fold hydrolase [Deltaproteobacteria bacterium]|nr:alpha/beta fold hydrolase [Deltaproteobacteria bacterium]